MCLIFISFLKHFKTVELWKHLHYKISIQFVRTSFDDMLKTSAWDP